MKRIFLTTLCLLTLVVASFGQGAHNIKINEVMTNNKASIQDEYGRHNAWVELANTAFSTYNIRGMYITTNRAVLNEEMSVPERIKLMSIIPNGEARTNLTAREHLVFQLGSNPAEGKLHLTAPADPAKPLWIALYDGNGKTLIDSVSVPVLKENDSYARIEDGAAKWVVKPANEVTPGINNNVAVKTSKVDKLKAEDPHGFGITLLCMGVVFSCLALLFLFFKIFGWVADRRSKIAEAQPIKPVVTTAKKVHEVNKATANILEDGLELKGRDKEIYIAVIAMALKQYADDVHDVESGVITMKPHHSSWGSHSAFNNDVAHHGESHEIHIEGHEVE